MAKKITVGNLDIYAYPPHLKYLSAFPITITASKITELTALNFTFSPPVEVNIAGLRIDIINVKYINLASMDMSYIVEKFSALASIDWAMYPPRQNCMSAIDIYTKMLRSYEFGAVNISEIMLPTQTRYFQTYISASKIPKKSIAVLEIATGFPYEVLDVKIPLTTYWGIPLRTELSGAADTVKKSVRTNIVVTFSSSEEYNHEVMPNKFGAQIVAAISKTHILHTDIYIDTSNWITMFDWVPTNIQAAGTQVCSIANHLFVLGGRTQKVNVTLMGREGMYIDDNPVKSLSTGYADLNGKYIWMQQKYDLGYTQYSKMVKYGIIASIPCNIAGFDVDSAWLGIPVILPRLMDLDITVNLLQTNTIKLSDYQTPQQVFSVYGVAFGSSGKIRSSQGVGYIDITDLIKRYQQLYTGGNMVLQIVPSSSLIYQDLLLQNPFLYRVISVDTSSNYILKIFNKREQIG